MTHRYVLKIHIYILYRKQNESLKMNRTYDTLLYVRLGPPAAADQSAGQLAD
jgi:hypothetical protein